uniref:Uncharacterized protein n=1 Tax=Lepeophtheirus salmonis TaxID=72036 RepID=A0A0K2UKK1_LEPSM
MEANFVIQANVIEHFDFSYLFY